MIGNFDSYMIFYSTAKNKNMTAAAAELYLSQPTVSRGIRELEDQLGCTLFIRSKKGVELTPEGELLFRHVETAFGHLESAEQKLKQYKNLENGMIQIGATEMTLQYFLQPYLEDFRGDYPGVRVKLSLGEPETLYDQLKSGMVDIAVFPAPPAVDETVLLTPLAEVENILIAGERFRYLAGSLRHLADLVREPFILLRPGTGVRTGLEQFFSEHHISISPEYEVSTMQMVISLVQSDMGIGFVPKPYVHEELKRETVFQIELAEKPPGRQICLCTSRIYPQSAACRELIRCLEDGSPGTTGEAAAGAAGN
ncbi:MAG: LysR family transcriptional regulator [Clostridiales bacterium]|nr:LysR family transcriptional regulator [Clostridiales bacterium]